LTETLCLCGWPNFFFGDQGEPGGMFDLGLRMREVCVKPWIQSAGTVESK